jgi:hypothetical protein
MKEALLIIGGVGGVVFGDDDGIGKPRAKLEDMTR